MSEKQEMFLVCLDNVRVAADAKGPVYTEEGENQSWNNLFVYDIMNYILQQYFSKTSGLGPFCNVCISKYVFEEHQHSLVEISKFPNVRIDLIAINLVPFISPISNQFNSSKGLFNSVDVLMK